MNDDPADERAKARRDLGLSRELAEERAPLPDPSRGGSRGYPVTIRRREIDRVDDGHEPAFASMRSIYRWRTRLHPYRMTGNRQKDSLCGTDQVLLAFYLQVYPEAESDEVAIFIFDNGGDLYSRQMIDKRCKELMITKKKASTEVFQAFLPVNIRKCRWFWTLPAPLGVVGTPRRNLIDVDEFGVALERMNRNTGQSHVSIRVRKPGFYTRNTKLTVLVAIEPGDHRLADGVRGSRSEPRRWIQIVRNTGTTALVFSDFIETVCNDIENNPIAGDLDSKRVFIWDNLASHLSPTVVETVENRQGPCVFSIIPRPPYQPKYGPIEYKICDTIASARREAQSHWNTNNLEHAIIRAFGSLSRGNYNFDNTFDHCGYSLDGAY